MKAAASIVTIGDELILGKLADGNAHFLARELAERAVPVRRITTVGDDQRAIISALQEAVDTSQLVLTTGGLGPTADDLTRVVVSEFCQAPLVLSQDALEKLAAHAAIRGRELNENNKRQAYFPRGAERLLNSAGTADAFVTQYFSKDEVAASIICLPGVPQELRVLFKEQISPWIEKTIITGERRQEQVLQVYGLPESRIGELIEQANLSQAVNVAYRPSFPVVMLTVSVMDGAGAAQKLHSAVSTISLALGEEYIFSNKAEESLADRLGALLRAKGLTLAAAESCTGGLLAHRIVSTPGASDYFLTSAVTYSNSAKEILLGVNKRTLAAHGAVSEQVACEMAQGARERIGADIAVSTTGIAGPTGGSAEKPVGTVWIGYADKNGVSAKRHHVPYERNAFRELTAMIALDTIRRRLLGLNC